METHPLTDEEQQKFFELLRRVCENHVDQWFQVRVETSSGVDFFVDISLSPCEAEEDEYATVNEQSRLVDHWRTGEPRRLGPMARGRWAQLTPEDSRGPLRNTRASDQTVVRGRASWI
jgi:hypothetical protein